MSREKKRIGLLFADLIGSEATNFPKSNKKLDAPDARGVYLILSLRNSVLHVGSTPRGEKGIHNRLYDHMHNRSSFSKKYLNFNGSELRNGYKFKYVVVPNDRQRALLEAYAIGELLPKHIGTG